jgi:hypothetical protein
MDKRAQLNMRLTQENEKQIEELRRKRSPIPSVTDLFRELLSDAYEREIAKGRGRK